MNAGGVEYESVGKVRLSRISYHLDTPGTFKVAG